jgi:CRISPR/Cas system CSM-associated protein Csm3 (group 7 of RAMP superfamily)
MIVYRIGGILTALSPVFHGGNEKTGAVVLLNRLKFIIDGKPTDVPIVSGNQVRGRLRRLLTEDFLELSGYKMDLSQKKHQKLYHTLFAGGVLTEAEEESGVIDLNLKFKIVKYVLPLRLFGCSYANQMIEGRLLVGHLLPVCKELKEYIGIESELSFYQLITRAFQTRRDELRDTKQSKEEEDTTVQAIVEYECFAPGTKFYHEIVLETTKQEESLDLSTLYRAVKLWQQTPYIGGKSSVGFGKLRIDYSWLNKLNDSVYLDFVEKNKNKIVEVLNELVEVF